MLSVVLTIHNKENLVERCLGSILSLSKDMSELIIVLDGCTDNSQYLVEKRLGNCDIIHKVVFTDDVFETKANNAGLREATQKYVILVQDDVVVDELGWDSRIIKPLQVYDDIFAVTAKNAHNNYLTGKKPGSGHDLIKHGEITNGLKGPRDRIEIRDSVNRGPLALDRDKALSLNFFDEVYAPFVWDDHDICYRAKEKGWFCGSYSVKFISEKQWGTTRENPKSHSVWKTSNEKNQKIFYERYYDLLLKPNKETLHRTVK
jgi:glycosyltransferase involved in cell wall biosynthesis